jgi:hypothetical protein
MYCGAMTKVQRASRPTHFVLFSFFRHWVICTLYSYSYLLYLMFSSLLEEIGRGVGEAINKPVDRHEPLRGCMYIQVLLILT